MDIELAFAFDNPKHSDYTLTFKSGATVHRRMHANSLILSSYSKYFVALFTNDMKETHEKEVDIELSSYDAALFYSVIKSFYTGELTLPSLSELSVLEQQGQQTNANETQQEERPKRGRKRKIPDNKGKGKGKEIEEEKNEEEKREESEFPVDSEEFQKVQVYVDVIKLLDRFGIEKRFKNCVDLLKKERKSVLSACYQLSILNGVLEHIAEMKEYKPSLVDFITKEYINFDKLWDKDEFLQLPSIALKSILESDDLLVSCEATVLQALRKWINHKPEKRECYLPELLPLVRFTQIDLVYLTDYLLGANNFFEVEGECDVFLGLLHGVIRYHSLNHIYNRGIGCFPDGDFINEWLKKRAGYKEVEKSQTIDWECNLEEHCQDSRKFYFRGVFYYFELFVQHVEHVFCIKPDRVLTSGGNDGRFTNNHIQYTLSALNYQTKELDYLYRNCITSGVNQGKRTNEKLKISQSTSPYIKPNTEGKKRIVHLFASIKSVQVAK
eukprot:TRINITY_DN1474_c0_g5_i2.p1 TRINITY_DN1474_c0_g5~~TRINITY_DN1474_c0_g5_i2.p1  ORF type:complete len:498 (-),score=93.68 TRINITY_DN1474_c0_g5_i2:110-1603(-)